MNTIESFWNNIERIPFSGCWIWTGGDGKLGYGRYTLEGKRYAAHRLAYELATGKKPLDKFVCHICDVPACVNPAHLFLGTQQDNLADMRTKGREINPPLKRGEAHYIGKLSDEKVRAIRARRANGELVKNIAVDYDITPGLVSHVATRRKWKHVA